MTDLPSTPAVPALDAEAENAARARQGRLTKPPGSLGRLEDLSVWVAACQARARRTSSPGRGSWCSPAITG